MGWKNWPVWVKGGVIGAVLGIILNLLASVGIPIAVIGFILLIPFIFFVPFLIKLGICSGEFCSDQPFIWIPFIVIEAFIIGSVIGFIIGKIKSSRKIRNIYIL